MEKPILIERLDRVVVVTLNRPAARNALNTEIMRALGDELTPLDREPGVGGVGIKGPDTAFSGGADINAMGGGSYSDV